jgi:hypothetical protein
VFDIGKVSILHQFAGRLLTANRQRNAAPWAFDPKPSETHMNRQQFLQSLAALAAAGALTPAQANIAVKMMIPANPGGGWDSTGAHWAKP